MTEEFRITGPGFYRTRGGQKAEVESCIGGSVRPWKGRLNGKFMEWQKDGHWITTESTYNYDIIGPWVEEQKNTYEAIIHMTDEEVCDVMNANRRVGNFYGMLIGIKRLPEEPNDTAGAVVPPAESGESTRAGAAEYPNKADAPAVSPVPGVSLRDWFAGQALSGLLVGKISTFDAELVAERSIKYADAVMKAREE